MKHIQSVPNIVACSEYFYDDGDFNRRVRGSIYSPNYQEDGLASHWRSRVLFHDSHEKVIGSISGIGADSLQALSQALKMSGYKLLEISKCSKSLSFSDSPDSKNSVLELISTDSTSIVELDNSTATESNSLVVAELESLSLEAPEGKARDFSISLSYPIWIEGTWHCTVKFGNLNQCKTYSSSDSARVLAKTLRGLHRQLLGWKSQGFKIRETDGQDLLDDSLLRCFFHSAEEVAASFHNKIEP